MMSSKKRDEAIKQDDRERMARRAAAVLKRQQREEEDQHKAEMIEELQAEVQRLREAAQRVAEEHSPDPYRSGNESAMRSSSNKAPASSQRHQQKEVTQRVTEEPSTDESESATRSSGKITPALSQQHRREEPSRESAARSRGNKADALLQQHRSTTSAATASENSRVGRSYDSYGSDSDQETEEEQLSARGRRVERLWKELRKVGACPKFDNTAASYVEWCSKFRLCLQITVEKTNLCYLLEEDPDDSEEEQRASVVVAALIITSAPIRIAEKMTSWDDSQRTARAAWEYVRTAMIGDERAYVRTLEAEFTALKWKNTASWEEFLNEFDSIDRRMCAMGKGRDDDSKRVQVLNAALGRRSASGREIHSRMAMVTQQHSDSTHVVWLREITKLTSAFATEEETLTAGRKHMVKQHAEETDASSVSTQSRRHGGGTGAGTSAATAGTDLECWNYKKNKQCHFGGRCRFQHGGRQPSDIDKSKRSRSADGSASSTKSQPARDSNEGKTEACELWKLKGRCQHGSKCAFRHDEADKGVEAVEVEAANRMAEHPVIKLDSACSASMTPNSAWVIDAEKLSPPQPLTGAFHDSQNVATHKGRGAIPLPDGTVLHIDNILLAPQLRSTLLSAGELQRTEGWRVNGEAEQFERVNKQGEVTCIVAIENVNDTWRLTRMLPLHPLSVEPVTTRTTHRTKDDQKSDKHSQSTPTQQVSANVRQPHSISPRSSSPPSILPLSTNCNKAQQHGLHTDNNSQSKTTQSQPTPTQSEVSANVRQPHSPTKALSPSSDIHSQQSKLLADFSDIPKIPENLGDSRVALTNKWQPVSDKQDSPMCIAALHAALGHLGVRKLKAALKATYHTENFADTLINCGDCDACPSVVVQVPKTLQVPF
jgi:hypothetical protein